MTPWRSTSFTPSNATSSRAHCMVGQRKTGSLQPTDPVSLMQVRALERHWSGLVWNARECELMLMAAPSPYKSENGRPLDGFRLWTFQLLESSSSLSTSITALFPLDSGRLLSYHSTR